MTEDDTFKVLKKWSFDDACQLCADIIKNSNDFQILYPRSSIIEEKRQELWKAYLNERLVKSGWTAEEILKKLNEIRDRKRNDGSN